MTPPGPVAQLKKLDCSRNRAGIQFAKRSGVALLRCAAGGPKNRFGTFTRVIARYASVEIGRAPIAHRGPLQKYDEMLPKDFVRASRHMIINLNKVQRLRRISRDLAIVYFAGSETEATVRIGGEASIVIRTA